MVGHADNAKKQIWLSCGLATEAGHAWLRERMVSRLEREPCLLLVWHRACQRVMWRGTVTFDGALPAMVTGL